MAKRTLWTNESLPANVETFKWVSLLGAAELQFSSEEDHSFALFRMREEHTAGPSPQFAVRAWNRYRA